MRTRPRSRSLRPAAVVLAACALAAPAFARQPAAEPPSFVLPSLDELLGLEQPAGDGTPEATRPADLPEAADPNQNALDRQLSSGEMAEALDEAVTLMRETGERLGGARDVGIITQRLQEDILARLDAVITSAEQQNSSNSSSSSSQQQGQQQQQASQPGQQGEQQEGEQNTEGDPSSGENDGDTRPPGLREGGLAPPVSPDGGAWGRLPPRVRDSLVQGSSDVFSSLYRRMTELYYKRLAEEERR